MSYYAANPHYAADDFSKDTERRERADAEASRWFNDLTKPQLARYNDRMSVASAYKGAPRWDRERAAAQKEFAETTVEASRVCEMVQRDMMELGEISEATSYAFDELMVAQTMQQAAE